MEKFQSWYQKYINVCNKKYTEYSESLQKYLTMERTNLQKMIDVRMRMGISLLSSLDEKIKQKNEQIADIDEQITRLSSVREEMDLRLAKVNAVKIYQKLKKHPKIAKIEVNDDELNIITKKLEVKGKNIGHFKFTFNPLNNRLFIRNLEYVVDDMFDHWHVKYGEPCLADWKPILWRYIDTFQIFFFIDTLIHYLLLSSSHHAYKPFEEWIKSFEAKEEVKTKQINSSDLSADQLVYVQRYQSTTAVPASDTATGWYGVSAPEQTITFAYWVTIT